MANDDLFGIQETGKRSMRIDKSHKSQWVETSFIGPTIEDDYARKYGQTDGYLGAILTKTRLTSLLVIIGLFLTVLLSRSAQLQIVQGATYKDRADQNRLRIQPQRADRGLIYDRFKTPLVRNVANYIAIVHPHLLPSDSAERNQALENLYQTFFIQYVDETQDDFVKRIDAIYHNPSKRSQPLIIAEFIKQDHAILLQIEAETTDYLAIDLTTRREYLNEGPPVVDPNDLTVYPAVKSLSHILGYMSRLRDGEYNDLKQQGYLFNDVKGRTGLEFTYEQELRGIFGQKTVQVTAQGAEQQVLTEFEATDGFSLMTTLDLELQRAIEESVNKHLEELEKKKAAVIVMQPQSGEILAMVSLPTFDNNDFAKRINPDTYKRLIEDENNPLFARAVSGEYPSGSTFKPIVAAAALEENLISPFTPIQSSGGIRISQWFFPDWRAGGHGTTNVYHALADSVNTYFYVIGGGHNDFEGLGVAKITDYAHEFGLANTLGIDLPGEKSGFLPSKAWKEEVKQERWYIGDTYHLAIGQGDLLVTPLQVASFFSTIANGGTVYKPYLVSALIDENTGDVVSTFSGEELNSIPVSEKNVSVIQDGLRRVVTRGSGKRLGGLSIESSGKTGTAQWHSVKEPHAWYAGYAPTDNPQIAFSILVEEGEEGSGITVSIANDILQWWATNRSQF